MTEFIPGKKYRTRGGEIMLCLATNPLNIDYPYVFADKDGLICARRNTGWTRSGGYGCTDDVLPEEVIESVEFEPEVKGSGVMIPWIHIPMQFSGKRIRVRIEVIEGEGK
jgi:hypothetical protein